MCSLVLDVPAHTQIVITGSLTIVDNSSVVHINASTYHDGYACEVTTSE
jgi:hypothetical protein